MSLATTITNLETRRDAIAAELATYTSSSGAGPDFSIDGVSINWDAHIKMLREELLEIQKTIEILGGPCIVRIQGR